MNRNCFMVPNSIFRAGLTKYELLVLIYLLRCQNNRQIAFPSYQRIAKCCAISKSKAVRVVNGFTKKGILRKQIRPQSYRKNHSNPYVIVLKNNGALETNTLIPNDKNAPRTPQKR